MVVDDVSDAAPAAERRRFRPAQAGWIELHPERERVRVRCGGEMDTRTADEVRRECEGLFERGFDRVILDMSHTTSISPAAAGMLAAADRGARSFGVRFTLIPGGGEVAATLRRIGLLGQPELEGAAEVFLDWTR